ncbi:uncharacterized protein BT62DRAFT_920211 [Guyanagaster necrorhizus]|uniref:Uncharacterized protein n=1 Tax=Guyanagaster necrorhizus TaxID=856835 RepID=A0A9P7VSP6_9AGAR|nr:uncharacterized protein BT62DRAFT_923237 [Guyanagaster necrorhizus MCA 3950]XP_043039699.1 uncharacterized protein BT62DRAFT_920211 [Guyanagaster necrorhizus MCA 3950]KAG7441658.1 hypothetical protein BT62DRAFT_923237 [Guyanagaster necrorhizus MCA 3950]KAG7446199.1 hypothetical protein BT62DRAFT_920211 [Guyanagaster necrorhizus MCA 3950]
MQNTTNSFKSRVEGFVAPRLTGYIAIHLVLRAKTIEMVKCFLILVGWIEASAELDPKKDERERDQMERYDHPEQAAPPVKYSKRYHGTGSGSSSVQEQKKISLIVWACVAFRKELQRYLKINRHPSEPGIGDGFTTLS